MNTVANHEHSGQPFERDLPDYFDETTEKDLPLKAIRDWKKDGFPSPNKTQVEIPVEELATLGVELPKPLVALLKKHPHSCMLENEHEEWSLFPPNKLLVKTKVERKNYPCVLQLPGYAKTLRKVLASDSTEDDKGKPFPIERIEKGISVGSNDSGDILFLDPSTKFSVWAFIHDGGDVEKLASSFQALLKKSNVTEC